MKRNDIFHFLDAVGFSQADAEAYFKRSQAEKLSAKFITLLPVACWQNGKLIPTNLLDVNNLSAVRGIIVNNRVVSLVNKLNVNINEAGAELFQNKIEGYSWDFPDENVLEKIVQQQEAFAETVALLCRLGYKAEDLAAGYNYWTRTTYLDHTSVAVQMYDCSRRFVSVDQRNNCALRAVIDLK